MHSPAHDAPFHVHPSVAFARVRSLIVYNGNLAVWLMKHAQDLAEGA